MYHCFASFKQSPLDFFKLVDSRLILMLLYDSPNLIISGVHQSHLCCWGHKSEKVKLRGLDYVAIAYKMCQYAVLPQDKIVIRNVFRSYYGSMCAPYLEKSKPTFLPWFIKPSSVHFTATLSNLNRFQYFFALPKPENCTKQDMHLFRPIYYLKKVLLMT